MPLSSNQEELQLWWKMWIEESITKGISMGSGSHKGKAEKRFHKQTSGLPFFPAWMELPLLPSNSGGFLRTNIHTGVSEATRRPAFVYCMIWTRTNPNTEAKQHMFCCLRSPSFPADDWLWRWEIILWDSQLLSPWSSVNSTCSLRADSGLQGNIWPFLGSHAHCLHQMFWIWFHNQQRPKLSLTQRWLIKLRQIKHLAKCVLW